MGNYDKYICATLRKRHMLPGPPPKERDKLAAEGRRISMEHVLWIDGDVIPGAYYGESTWIWPRSYPGQITMEEQARRTGSIKPMFPHDHGFPELLSWWGGDPDHPEETAEMTMIMGDEEIPLDTSWIAYVPAGMVHMPKTIRSAKIPVCHWTFGPAAYTREKDGEGVKDEHEEARKDYVIVPGKKDNLKYFVMGGEQKEVKRPSYIPGLDSRRARAMAFIDETVMPDVELGCYVMYVQADAVPAEPLCVMDAHKVPHGTYFTLTAMNYADITDLAAEAELWIGGERHVIDRSFGAYIPPGVEQGPLFVRNIRKQLFFVIAYPIGKGIEKFPGR